LSDFYGILQERKSRVFIGIFVGSVAWWLSKTDWPAQFDLLQLDLVQPQMPTASRPPKIVTLMGWPTEEA
jgi:hypothetical protein